MPYSEQHRLARREAGRFGSNTPLGVTTLLDTELAEQCARPELLPAVSDALDELAKVEAALAPVMDLKFFCGVSMAEMASMLNASERTVRRQREKARMVLFRALQPE